MAYAPPNPKRVQFDQRQQREAQEQARQVESCYRQHRTGQQRYAAWLDTPEGAAASLAAHLGIDVTVRLV